MKHYTWCPNCRAVIEIDRYGFTTCLHCNKCFVIQPKKKQINISEFIKRGYHKERNNGRFVKNSY